MVVDRAGGIIKLTDGVIDFHTHIFPPDIIRARERVCRQDPAFSLLYGNSKAPMANAGHLEAYLQDAGVEVAVACGFGFADQGILRDCNDYIIEASRNDPRIVAFTALSGENLRAWLREGERCLDLGARGIGEIGFYLGGFGPRDGKRLDRLARLVVEARSILMIHVNEQVGHYYGGKTQMDLAVLAGFVCAHQDLTTVLAHLGGGLCFYEFMPEIRRHFVNVYYDTAAIPFLYDKSVFSYLARFLDHKVLFGSDFPLLSCERYREGASAMGAKARQRIMETNARRLLGG